MPELTAPTAADPSSLAFSRVRYTKDAASAVATVAIDRQDVLNAFDFQTLLELSRAFEDASWDDSVAVVVVTGAGDRAFCTGADLDEQATFGATSGQYWRWMGAFIEMHDRLRHIGKPTIARINGVCVGGGQELQLACDLSVMVDDTYIRHVGPEHGSVPAGGATQWLPLVVGDRRAREIVMLCDEIPAARAAEWGLVNRALPREELDATVDQWVEKLARKLPQATRYAKQQLNWWRDLSWHETVGHARDWLALSMLSEETQAAVRHFLERRRE
jgi:enoyl-CoA hydratase/carnithine racemase